MELMLCVDKNEGGERVAIVYIVLSGRILYIWTKKINKLEELGINSLYQRLYEEIKLSYSFVWNLGQLVYRKNI